ncbi:phospholipase A1 member A-like [Anticarsia gemmatalis]|uniref:phospholipase A1 member A-like n=1 Tax=Anticarsia gemmatalis TaxID=129554 RepID=UPI003F770F55
MQCQCESRARCFVVMCVWVWGVFALVACSCSQAAPDALAAIGALLPPAVADNFDGLIKAASATCEALPLELLLARPYSIEMPAIDIFEFKRNSHRVYRAASAHEHIKNKPPTLVLYIPGWWNTPTDESSNAIVQALLTKHPVVLVLDTRLSFCRGYVSSVTRVNPLSHLLYSFIKNLQKAGLNPSSVHLIGFSLGAHVAGMTGKLVQKKLKTKLGRITALDPAKPCFTKTEHKLDKRDAEFVQVIHSSAGVLGLEDPIGHTDVYVNGVAGKQPECRDRSISLECDHALAWKLYSASAMNDRTLMGKRCDSWEELLESKCNGSETVLGYSCSTKSRGMFLYKSEEREKRQEPRLKVFNPFSLWTGWPFS